MARRFYRVKGRLVEWTTIAVSHDTKAALERVRESMLAGDALSVSPLGSEATRSGKEDTRERIGLDQVVRRLIADRLRWQRRRAAAGRKRQGVDAPGESGPTTAPSGNA